MGDGAHEASISRTTVVELVIAWTVVLVPLTWGVAEVVVSSLALFR